MSNIYTNSMSAADIFESIREDMYKVGWLTNITDELIEKSKKWKTEFPYYKCVESIKLLTQFDFDKGLHPDVVNWFSRQDIDYHMLPKSVRVHSVEVESDSSLTC